MTASQATYTPWAQAFRDSYSRCESAFFVLHNNISDLFPLGGEYVSGRAYVESMLLKSGFIIVYYDVSRGMRFQNTKDAEEFVGLANQNLPPGQRIIRSVFDFPKESIRALAFIEAFIVGIECSQRPVALVLDYAEHLAPNGDPQSMTEIDRINTVTLQRFAQMFYERLQDSGARKAVCFAFTSQIHNLHPDLVRSELVTTIDVPRPTAEERARFLRWQQAKLVVENGESLAMNITETQLVELTAGLTLTGIRHLFLRALHSAERILTINYVSARKRELISRDSRGMLEILSSHHGLDAVGGNDAIKSFLKDTAQDLRDGRPDVPVGVVCPGPNGVGKTFIAKAFVHDAGINAVSLRNFRGMYVGQTESNLDTIFNILKAMTPNIVMIDEADKTLGNERSDAGNKVDERVFGAFTAFMGDPEYRGKIFWMLLTARPFNLAPDTGRPGRVEEHLPILAPETFAEKKAVLKAVCESCGIRLISLESASLAASPQSTNMPTDDELKKLFAVLGFFTPAALELIGNRSRRRARRASGFAREDQNVIVDLRVFIEEAESFVPEGSMLKQQLQTLEAVLYTNHLNYLPEPWKSRLRDDVNGLSREREELLGLVASL